MFCKEENVEYIYIKIHFLEIRSGLLAGELHGCESTRGMKWNYISRKDKKEGKNMHWERQNVKETEEFKQKKAWERENERRERVE